MLPRTSKVTLDIMQFSSIACLMESTYLIVVVIRVIIELFKFCNGSMVIQCPQAVGGFQLFCVIEEAAACRKLYNIDAFAQHMTPGSRGANQLADSSCNGL